MTSGDATEPDAPEPDAPELESPKPGPGSASPEPASSEILAGLNPAQQAAVTHGDGPALVVAGAGSGKTRVLTRRIAYLIDHAQVNPYEVLAITFTNKAADEMRERVAELIGPIAKQMWISTFHRACVQILRRNAHRLDFPNSFTIYDQSDATRLVRDIVSTLGYDSKLFPHRKIYNRISSCKNLLQSPEFVAENAQSRSDQVLADVYEQYQDSLQAAGAMDFDDLLGKTVQLLATDEEMRNHYQSAFAHILVDEYQDTNAAQNELVRLLGQKHRNVFVVGDSDQSIYAFRGADIENINRFDRAFGEDCATYVLEQNYRSTQPVLDAANALIAKNMARIPKSLWTETAGGAPIFTYRGDDAYDEARFVARQIRKLGEPGGGTATSAARGATATGTNPADIAVFYRSNAQSRAIEEVFVEEGLPYKVIGGTRFYDRKEVRDALGFLRVAVNPADVAAAKRVLNLPARGIGKTSMDRLEQHANRHDMSFSSALRQAGEAGLKGKPAKGVAEFVGLLDELREIVPDGPHAVIAHALDKSGYSDALIAEDTDDANNRLENLTELLDTAAGYETCEQLLEQVALVNDTDELPDGGQVSLMTLHAAKGLEYPVVFFTGLEESLCPHYRSLAAPEDLEEERRLAYVGITRAQQTLYLTLATRRTLHGQATYNTPSRFLTEITSDVTEEQIQDLSDNVIGRGTGFSRSGLYRRATAV